MLPGSIGIRRFLLSSRIRYQMNRRDCLTASALSKVSVVLELALMEFFSDSIDKRPQDASRGSTGDAPLPQCYHIIIPFIACVIDKLPAPVYRPVLKLTPTCLKQISGEYI